ncbi:RapZ C-terminal domain-containing protein [Melioribacter sp. OK-6-Me]|uniref:RapZ C-terminal domain-containing protein n=1 Tax=unclassified Melioribacter TaxID=2627329 RepID=UPI003EDA1438
MIIEKILKELYRKEFKVKLVKISPLPPSGSARKYYRLHSGNNTVIGAYNEDTLENDAFFYLTGIFKKLGLNVPEIYSIDHINKCYLLEDLGDVTLFSLLRKKRKGKILPADIVNLYKKALEELSRFQLDTMGKIDFRKCYPRKSFDELSMKWDLNYFKYYFLKPSGIPFDEDKLEKDFNKFIEYLSKADGNHFMYRDFNSRNILVKNNDLYFIDYQGGRRGPLQYDIASFLYDSKADLSDELRMELLNHYLNIVSKFHKVRHTDFMKYYYEIVLLRLIQMFGAYGNRGLFEGKAHFLQSIPYAVKNLESILNKIKISRKIPELFRVLNEITHNKKLDVYKWNPNHKRLIVRVYSFSYRNKIPNDISGNGGGFVFDCRAIPNPGKIEKYKHLTGRNKKVAEFLKAQPAAIKFLNESISMVDQVVESYLERGWRDLMVCYGCTGGQHRSVFCAENLARHLKEKYNVKVILQHTGLTS